MWTHDIMKQVINETSGYIVQQGQRMDLTEPLAEMKKSTVYSKKQL
jgi:hypothetical protein